MLTFITTVGLNIVRKGQYDQAISDFNKALEINSWFAVAYNNRGIAYYFKKEYDKSLEDFKKLRNWVTKFPLNFLTIFVMFREGKIEGEN
jgi:lipoprotein NlpI